MLSLKKVLEDNLIFAFAGANFTNPIFRELTGQLPYEIKIHTIHSKEEKKVEMKFRKLLDESDEPFIFIVRGKNARLKEVLFVPVPKGTGTDAILKP